MVLQSCLKECSIFLFNALLPASLILCSRELDHRAAVVLPEADPGRGGESGGCRAHPLCCRRAWGTKQTFGIPQGGRLPLPASRLTERLTRNRKQNVQHIPATEQCKLQLTRLSHQIASIALVTLCGRVCFLFLWFVGVFVRLSLCLSFCVCVS